MTGVVDCGSEAISIYPGEGQSAYFTILDTAGYVHELQQIHGVGFYDRANKIVAGKNSNLYIGGKIENNIWGGSLSPYTSVGGDSDYFIMKYGVDCGCTAMPVANYSFAGTDLIKNFTYTGTSGVDSVRWSFGDGGTSTSLAPSHTYSMAGTYTVCVRVYSPCGNDMRCYEVPVSCSVSPDAHYIDTGNAVHGFIYTGTMGVYYDSVRWDFGDGAYDTGTHVIHTYPVVTDTFHVCVKVYTRCGTDTFCKDVIVTAPSVSSLLQEPINIKVFPNPTTNSLYISGHTGRTDYRLLNVVGIAVQQGTLSAGTAVVQLSDLPPGHYLLELNGDNGTRKVVRVIRE
ncbi:hypothetical protein GCM10023093_07520 [Nemorincola caseinilytica]|uniref:PKD domain-containing protein n=1 Tax=Nemorincola caseinilytica TaxID=2054315 RepID=A0ABP8NA87_9BACT